MESAEFTTLLEAWQNGSKEALDRLTPVVYRELHRLASSLLNRERPGHTLQPTALIHEAYLKLAGHQQEKWHSRAHFFSVASHIMRQILAKHARARNALKRGGSAKSEITFDDAMASVAEPGAAFVALDDALTELARFDDRKSKLIELKYFGGLTGTEIAEVLSISTATVTREARLAEAWLQSYLTAEGSRENP